MIQKIGLKMLELMLTKYINYVLVYQPHQCQLDTYQSDLKMLFGYILTIIPYILTVIPKCSNNIVKTSSV